jgi:antitoxin component YwqK of YwqJK toxin-antitoxin module
MIILLCILAVGCDKKNKSIESPENAKIRENTGETNPQTGGVYLKDLRTHRGYIWGGRSVNWLITQGIIVYHKDSDTPYTGKAFALAKLMEKSEVDVFSSVKLDSRFTRKKCKLELNFKEGKFDGPLITWLLTGQKKYEENYKDRKAHGLWLSWHNNGERQFEAEYKNGELIQGSEKFWNSKGEPVNSLNEALEPLAKNQPKLEVVNHEKLEERKGVFYLIGLDTPYTGKSFTLHKNGLKKWEINFKNGKEYGIFVGWDENGLTRFEANMEDGKREGLMVGWHENGQKMAEENYKGGKLVEGSQKYWNSKGEPVATAEESRK